MNRNVEIGQEIAVGMETDDLQAVLFVKDPKRQHIVKIINFPPGDYTVLSYGEIQDARIFVNIDVADHAGQNECDGHDKSVGIKRVSNYRQKSKGGIEIPLAIPP